MKRYTVLWLTIAFLSTWVQNAGAADTQGRYMAGGGFGSTTCPQFVDAMARARQAGGVSSPHGVNAITNFMNYVLGFQTGYNLMSNGVFDIFAKIDVQHFDALFAIEAWCKDHPAAKFSDGVIALADKLAEKERQQNE